MGFTPYALAGLAGVLLAECLPGIYIITSLAAILIASLFSSKLVGWLLGDPVSLHFI